MMYAQAVKYMERFAEAGFRHVSFRRVARVGRDVWRQGYEVIGESVITGKRLPFAIRSTVDADKFIAIYGESQPRQ